MKILGHKAYGSIPHLPNSRLGVGDHHIPIEQANLCTKKCSTNYTIIVQEKLDGSNVSVAKVNGAIIPLIRSGYKAESSKHVQHILFAGWVYDNEQRFADLLNEGERICGEWLAQAHGTRYNLWHEPFVPFDIMVKHNRINYNEFINRALSFDFIPPHTLHIGSSFSIEQSLKVLNDKNAHNALDESEGVIYRVEKDNTFCFITKYVKPDKVDGKYFPQNNNGVEVWNWYDESVLYRQTERMKEVEYVI